MITNCFFIFTLQSKISEKESQIDEISRKIEELECNLKGGGHSECVTSGKKSVRIHEPFDDEMSHKYLDVIHIDPVSDSMVTSTTRTASTYVCE